MNGFVIISSPESLYSAGGSSLSRIWKVFIFVLMDYYAYEHKDLRIWYKKRR
jgi:hypothetical protein